MLRRSLIRKATAGLMILVLLAITMQGAVPVAHAADTPVLFKGPYLIYKGNDTEMTVLWQLDSAVACTLEWGTDTLYSLGSAPVSEYNSSHQYSCSITGLTPRTKYYYRVTYRVTVPQGYASGSFRSAPPDDATNVKFMMCGDTQSFPDVHNKVAGGMLSTLTADPTFQTFRLLAGDLTSDGESESAWTNEFFPAGYANIQQLNENLPIQACMGNHEFMQDPAHGGALFQKYFPYPFVSQRYWSFDYGPVHIVVADQYDTGQDGVISAAQRNWIESDLAATTKPWKIILLHQPGWSAGGEANDPDVQNNIQPIAKQYGVAMIISGHNHYYARAVVDGVQHITTGGGGGDLFNPSLSYPYVQVINKCHHYCTIEIIGSSLIFNALTPEGVQIDSFTIGSVAPPTITNFLPPSGVVGTSVDILGTDFAGPMVVKFNGKNANFNVVSSTLIKATVPAGATSGLITVTTPAGTGESPSTFEVTVPPPPTISSFSPTSGVVGTSVDITGTDFTGATSVKFNGTSATFKVVSSTSISATVPAGAASGPISVTTDGGMGTSTSDFTVTLPPPPTISSFSPTSEAVGASVSIAGTNFTGATSVKFNGASATFNVVSSTSISAAVPAGATSGPISVTADGQTATSTSSFTVPPPPTISSFSPTSGAVGTGVDIVGTNFDGATSVKFNGTGTIFKVESSTSISATVPVGATSGPISVTGRGGTATSTSSFTVPPPPTISGFSPASGVVGTSVDIVGTNFDGVTSVIFNGTEATFKVVSPTSISATVPIGATSGLICVTGRGGGTAKSTSDFTVTVPPPATAPKVSEPSGNTASSTTPQVDAQSVAQLAPTISSVTPGDGKQGESFDVTITGTDFSGATSVNFGDGVTVNNFNIDSATQITANITIDSSASGGERAVSIVTSSGTGTVAGGFMVGVVGEVAEHSSSGVPVWGWVVIGVAVAALGLSGVLVSLKRVSGS